MPLWAAFQPGLSVLAVLPPEDHLFDEAKYAGNHVPCLEGELRVFLLETVRFPGPQGPLCGTFGKFYIYSRTYAL